MVQEVFGRFSKTEEKLKIPWKVLLSFFPKHFYRDEEFHWTSHWKYRVLYTNEKRSLNFIFLLLFLQNVVSKPTWMVSAKNLIHFTTCGIILK